MSRAVYFALIAAIAAGRLVELGISRRNERGLRAEGGRDTGVGTFRIMVLLHVCVFVFPVAEVLLFDRRFVPAVGFPALGLLVFATALRLVVIRTLGRFWSARAVVSPATQVCDRGPYRWIRHPNYVAVCAEILAIPLVYTCWISAIALTLWNGAVIAARVGEEERALFAVPGYAEKMGAKARFIPGIF